MDLFRRAPVLDMDRDEAIDEATVYAMRDEIASLCRTRDLVIDIRKMRAMASIGMRLLRHTDALWGSLLSPPTNMRMAMVFGCIACEGYSFNDSRVDWPGSTTRSFGRLWSMITCMHTADVFSGCEWVLDRRDVHGFYMEMGLTSRDAHNAFQPDVQIDVDAITKMQAEEWWDMPESLGTFMTTVEMAYVTSHEHLNGRTRPGGGS